MAFLQEKAIIIVKMQIKAKLELAIELEETFTKFAKLPFDQSFSRLSLTATLIPRDWMKG
jgi:hypothetical protein